MYTHVHRRRVWSESPQPLLPRKWRDAAHAYHFVLYHFCFRGNEVLQPPVPFIGVINILL